MVVLNTALRWLHRATDLPFAPPLHPCQLHTTDQDEMIKVYGLQDQLGIEPMALSYFGPKYTAKTPTAMMDACVWSAALTHRADAMAVFGGDSEAVSYAQLFNAIAGVAKAFPSPDRNKVASWFKQLGMDLYAGFVQRTFTTVSGTLECAAGC